MKTIELKLNMLNEPIVSDKARGDIRVLEPLIDNCGWCPFEFTRGDGMKK